MPVKPPGARKKQKPKQPQKPPNNDSGSDSESSEGYSDTQNERKNEYRKGGYHPVTVGELYNKQYRVVRKLGWGHFSTVWLVWDNKTLTFKAMKIMKSAEKYRETALDEIKLCKQISDGDPENKHCCAHIVDNFQHTGPNGKHICMVFEPLGDNILTLIEKYQETGVPIPIVKHITRCVLMALDYIHRSRQIIHTDIKPENILLTVPKQELLDVMKNFKPPSDPNKQISLEDKDKGTLTKSQKKRLKKRKQKGTKSDGAADPDDKSSSGGEDEPEAPAALAAPNMAPRHSLQDDVVIDPWTLRKFSALKVAMSSFDCTLADFGNACWTTEHFSNEIGTRQYTPPESILGQEYDCSADIWSFACTVFELLTGDFLFDPKSGEAYSRNEDQLALMLELLGGMPDRVLKRNSSGAVKKYLTAEGIPRKIATLKHWFLEEVLRDKYHFTDTKAAEISEFLTPMLHWDPKLRATAEEMLQHPWLVIQEDDMPAVARLLDESDEEDDSEDDDTDSTTSTSTTTVSESETDDESDKPKNKKKGKKDSSEESEDDRAKKASKKPTKKESEEEPKPAPKKAPKGKGRA